MNSLGIGLFWCVAQVTLLSAVAGVLYCAVRRFGPALGAFVSLSTLLLMSVVTIWSFSPWPNWMPTIESRLAPVTVPAPLATSNVEAESETLPAVPVAAAPRDVPTVSPMRAGMAAFWDQLRNARAAPESETQRWRWSSVLALVVLAGVVLGLLRLVVGLVAVRRYRQSSEPVSESAILELLDILAAELGCIRTVELRESRLLTGAATIGWRRPLILLPPAWRTWDERDRRAVLAHELAHIHQNDYLTWLAAQIGLALHFYHPLAHWLCGCLRLDQELVADSTAARLAGGRQSYLQSLAQIALQQSEPQVSWAARTFLPTRRTFLRRIEMLRDSKQWLSKPPRTLRWLAMAVLLGTGLVVLGLRGPAGLGPETAQAQQPKPQAAATSPGQEQLEPFALSHVPRDAFLVFAVRPAALLRQPALQPLTKVIRGTDTWEKDFGVQPDHIQSLQVIVLPVADGPNNAPLAAIVRCTDGESSKKLADHVAPQATKEVYGAQEYFRGARVPHIFYYQPDERTLVCAHDEGIIRRCIVAGQTGATSAKWATSWNEVAKNDAAALVNTAVVRQLIATELAKVRNQPLLKGGTAADAFRSQFAPFAPFWEQTDIAVAGLQVGDSLSLKITGKSASAEDAKRVHDTLKSAVTLGQNMLSQQRQAAANSRSPEGAIILGGIDIADQLLENVKIEQDAAQVNVTVGANAADTARLVSIVAPAVMSARNAARNAHAMNNLKQIGLAFHNYHDTFGSFPPAVLYSPNNVPRSWRVALLPFLEGADLYNQYRQDEPWDSELNKKILAQMPAVFRDPMDAPDSTNTSYFVLTGPGTVFDRPVGSRLTDIIDGTSNTILAVQAKRDVPWTKPEDIVYASDKPLPKLGGWSPGSFLAALCDGSVRSLSDTNEKFLRLLITRGDGQQIPPFDAQR